MARKLAQYWCDVTSIVGKMPLYGFFNTYRNAPWNGWDHFLQKIGKSIYYKNVYFNKYIILIPFYIIKPSNDQLVCENLTCNSNKGNAGSFKAFIRVLTFSSSLVEKWGSPIQYPSIIFWRFSRATWKTCHNFSKLIVSAT